MRAAPTFYWDSLEARPLPCPSGAVCEHPRGTTEKTIRLEQNYFRLHDMATVTYECDSANCIGGTGSTLCREGSGGVLCSVCDENYYLTTSR